MNENLKRFRIAIIYFLSSFSWLTEAVELLVVYLLHDYIDWSRLF